MADIGKGVAEEERTSKPSTEYARPGRGAQTLHEGITYRRLQAEDAPLIVELHQSVFPQEKVLRTIYASPGISRYLANLMALAELRHEHVFWGAWVGNDLVGYIHIREVADTLHLNYIAVAPAFRGKGIGSHMWKYLLLAAKNNGHKQVSLHVEEDNSIALDWYKRQGLQIVGETRLYEKDSSMGSYGTPHMVRAGGVELADWEAAEACQALYGFSQFRLIVNARTYIIGRLANRYFQLQEEVPVEIESVLHYIDAKRHILLLSPITVETDAYKKIVTTFNMKGTIARDV